MGGPLQALIANKVGGGLSDDGTHLAMQVGTTHTEIRGQYINGIVRVNHMGSNSSNGFVEELLIGNEEFM